MKYFILSALLISGCSEVRTPMSDPKFALNDDVTYKVNPFYRNVFSGKGTISSYTHLSNKEIAYEVEPVGYEKYHGCPVLKLVLEKDLELVKK